MKRINLYIGKEFLIFFSSCVFSLITIAITFASMAELDKIDSGGWTVFLFSILTGVPLLIEVVTPISILLATVLTYISLSKSSEIVAMMAAGVSLVQLLKPIFACCILISGFIYFNQSYIAPWLGSDIITNILREKPSSSKWRLFQDDLFYIYQANKADQSIQKTKIFKFNDQHRLNEYHRLDNLKLKNNLWVTKSGSQRIFKVNELEHQEIKDRHYASDKFPVIFEKEIVNPRYSPFWDVISLILIKKAGGIEYKEDVFALCQKLASIVVLFVMVVLALPFSLFAGRSFNTRMGIVFSVILGFIYWLMDQIFMTLFRADILIAELAAFGASILFLGIALILIYLRWS